MTKWEPIETAPRDGTPIIVSASAEGWDGVGTVCAAFYANQWKIYGVSNGMPSSSKYVSVQWLSEVIPTHWQPLPPPPTQEKEE